MQYGYACFYILPHIPDPALMFPPYPYEPALPETPVKIEECEEIEYTNKSNQFLKHFEKELKKTSIKYIKKVWSKEDDRLLLEMRKQNFKWTEISQQIANSNSQICKRRYFRLKQDEEKWPPELEEEIKHVCSTQSLKWEQKMNVLHTKFPQTMNYSKKMIKERYLTYLKESIKQEPWTLEEDMTLIECCRRESKDGGQSHRPSLAELSCTQKIDIMAACEVSRGKQKSRCKKTTQNTKCECEIYYQYVKQSRVETDLQVFFCYSMGPLDLFRLFLIYCRGPFQQIGFENLSNRINWSG